MFPVSMAVLGPWGPVVSGVVSFATSRLGNVLLAASLAYGVAHFREKWAWESSVATQEATLKQAHADELAREADASRKITDAATVRAQRGEALAGELQGQIDDLKAKEPFNVPAIKLPTVVTSGGPCAVDDDFAGRVRSLDAAAHRTPTPPRRSR